MTYGAEASAVLAHDLNNGFAGALSNLQYLSEELTTLAQDHGDALATTIRAMRRMSGLVANFVDVARFEDAAVKPIVQSVRMRSVIESVLEVNASSITRGITIQIDCPESLSARFDPALVERVLHNLVGNATRYCNPNGSISVSGKPWNDPESAEISVTNTGPQVPESIRSMLFGK